MKKAQPSPDELAELRKYFHNEFNSLMKKMHGDKWPAEGMTIKDYWDFELHKKREDEADKALTKVLEKHIGISPKKLKKANTDADWSFFGGMNFASNRNLKIDWVKNRVLKAIEQNDLEFFVRFGNTLKTKPQQISIDKISLILACYWDRRMGPVPALNGFTDEGLLELLQMLTGNNKLTFDQVRKTRQRLGLETKRTDHLVISGVERLGKNGESFRLKWVDKAKK